MNSFSEDQKQYRSVLLQLTFIRHGQSTANAEGILQGHSDYPLSQLGKEEAIAVGKQLKQENFSFDRIYSSDLRRAVETTELIAQELGWPKNTIIFTDLLREHSLGVYEGKVFNELSMEKKKFLQETWDIPDRKLPEGESVNDYLQRLGEFMSELEDIVPQLESILIITHGGSIYHLLKNLWQEAEPQFMKQAKSAHLGACVRDKDYLANKRKSISLVAEEISINVKSTHSKSHAHQSPALSNMPRY